MSAARPQFLLRTLGGLVLEQRAADGSSTIVQRGGKPLALLAYLSVADGKRVRRAVLADLLWGDESPDSARGSLRQALHTLRRFVGEELFDGDRAQLTLREGIVESDHTYFVDASVAGDVEEMARWYRGPFCDELVIRGAIAFDRWVESERHRLRRIVLPAVQREVASRTAAGDVARAAALARGLHEAEPTLEETAIAAADALTAHGAFDEARLVLENFRARQFALGETLSEAVSTRLAKLKSAVQGRAPSDGTIGDAFELGQRFVGREELFAELFRARDAAREGRLTRLVLVGPPGIGKSRVLDEFEARMRSRGARIARVRFLPAMRAIAGSALAEFARALCALPGAMGISETSASTLVGLLPELRERFPSATRSEVDATDLPRLRAAAVADLLAAVAEDRLITVLVDDDHNMDAASRAMLEDALRRPDLRLLEVRGTRSSTATLGVQRLAVTPFTARDLRALLESAGRLPEGEWVDVALQVLTEETGGVPQLLMLRLRELGARGALRLDGQTWRIDSAAELVERSPDVPMVGELIGSLPVIARIALQVLAHFRREMPESALLGVLAMVASEYRLAEWQGALASLESRGLVAVRDEGWAVAHDTIAEAALARQSAQEAEQVQLAIVRVYSTRERLTVPMLEHIALLCGATGQKGAALLLVRAASRVRSLRSVGVRGRTLAARVASAAGHAEWEPELLPATGWLSRWSGRGLIALGSGASLAAGALIWFGLMLWPRLVVDSAPMTDIPAEDGSATLAIQPRIAVVNGFGQRLTNYRGEILVRGVQGAVVGDTVIRPIGGLAQYERLAILPRAQGEADTTQFEFEFSSSRFAWPVRVPVAGAWGKAVDAFRPIRVAVNGTEVDSAWTVKVARDDSLRVSLTFEYSTHMPTSNYIVGAAATWLPRERSTVRLAGLPRPVRRAWQTSHFTLPSPPTPGEHHVIVLMDAEDSVDHIFSLTAWVLGLPRWNDGNDVLDLTPSQLRTLRQTGRLTMRRQIAPYLRPTADRVIGNQRQTSVQLGDTVSVAHEMKGFAITVVVPEP